ncbi:MAG: AraC family transcriptional regulator [Bacteroidia bacterium]|nr:AraC family transcriptional regulator [Bacteroidia bacterium]
MMKAIFFQIPQSLGESFSISLDEGPYFFTPLHFHYACQLSLILESTGTRFVGDNIERFEAGDLILLGSNIPHVFRNDPAYYETGSPIKARAIHVFFTPDFPGEKFMSLPETTAIRQLLIHAGRGLKIMGKTREIITEKMLHIREKQGLPRLLELLGILDILSHSTELIFLSSRVSDPSLKKSDSDKINDVFNFVMGNYQEEVRLEQVASVAHMSPTAFCRYFKRSTQKTFSQFLNEIRIGHACRLLREERFPIAEIGFICGFNNTSNFNRRFKTITGFTPKEYQRKHSLG